MLRVPGAFLVLFQRFAPLLRARSWRHAEVLLVGAILAPGQRTVTSILRVSGLARERCFVNYHRVLNRAAWSGREAGHVLLGRFCCILCGRVRLGSSFSMSRRRMQKLRADLTFKGRQFTAEVILWAVRWYLMFPISYRDLELMLQDRGVDVAHTTIYRWIEAYAPELEKRLRPHLCKSNGSWRVDETYVRVKGRWTYLYRAVDSSGQTIDFLLAAHRDAAAAKRFFRRALSQPHAANPRTITVDKNPAYPCAIAEMKAADELWRFARLRQAKYLNNIVEQDHRRVKRLVRPGLGFGSMRSARRTLAGYEAMAMIRKGQAHQVGGRDMRAQAGLVAQLFGLAA